ncbi:MAG TPA: chaperonin GroEL [Anaerolineaceae bacterium]
MTSEKKRKQQTAIQRRVIFLPRSQQAMQAGINQMINLVRPTLGPLPRYVCNAKDINRQPERLDCGGIIARRVIQIQDKDMDMGAMFSRHLLWHLYDTVGDGTTTAGVIFQKLYNEGLRLITAGWNPMILRKNLEKGLQIVLESLRKQTKPIEGKEQLSHLAQTICYDPALGKIIGEIFDTIGEYGRLELRDGQGRELVREYVEGMYWDGGYYSREMANDTYQTQANLENASILISNLDVNEPDDLIPLLVMAIDNEIKSILLVVRSISERAMGLILAKPNREKVHIVAVKTPGVDINAQAAAMEDMAILTGGRPLMEITGDQLKSVRLSDLGKSRKAWANNINFGISAGKGDPRQIRQHIAELRQVYRRLEDAQERNKMGERIGRLMSGSATLYVGANTPTEMEVRKELAEKTAQAMRGAMVEGVVPGGGATLLDCRRELLTRTADVSDPDEKAAYRILAAALEEPARVIMENAGVDPAHYLPLIQKAGAGFGFDVLANKVRKMEEAGILDPAAVVSRAVSGAVSHAGLGLTTEVLVHLRRPPMEFNT